VVEREAGAPEYVERRSDDFQIREKEGWMGSGNEKEIGGMRKMSGA